MSLWVGLTMYNENVIDSIIYALLPSLCQGGTYIIKKYSKGMMPFDNIIIIVGMKVLCYVTAVHSDNSFV